MQQELFDLQSLTTHMAKAGHRIYSTILFSSNGSWRKIAWNSSHSAIVFCRQGAQRAFPTGRIQWSLLAAIGTGSNRVKKTHRLFFRLKYNDPVRRWFEIRLVPAELAKIQSAYSHFVPIQAVNCWLWFWTFPNFMEGTRCVLCENTNNSSLRHFHLSW